MTLRNTIFMIILCVAVSGLVAAPSGRSLEPRSKDDSDTSSIMETFKTLMEIGGLILVGLSAIGGLIGHLSKHDKYKKKAIQTENTLDNVGRGLS
jgi:hypothetical protein